MKRDTPQLRPDVRLEANPDDDSFPFALVDPVFGRRIKLDSRGATMVRALDGTATVAQLVERLDTDEDALLRIIDSFERLQLLETPAAREAADDATRVRAHATGDPATTPLLIRDDARFSCTMCGSCCGGHNIGPVFQDVLDGLSDKLDRLQAETRSAKGLFVRLPGSPGADESATQVMCHQRDGSCVFLDDERRCRIHTNWGADSKPRACRIFPYEFVATPAGIAVTIQRECRGLLEAGRGKRLVDDEAAIRKLLALVGELETIKPGRMLAPGVPLPWSEWEELERSLHAAIDAHADSPTDALLAMRATIAGSLGMGAATPPAPPGDLRVWLGQLSDGLGAALGQLEAATPAPSEALRINIDGLRLFQRSLSRLRPDFARLVRPPATAEMRALFTSHAHHSVASKSLLKTDSVILGFARFALGWLCAHAMAVWRAREVKRRHLVAQDLMDGLVNTSFMLRHEDLVSHVLPHFDEPIVGLFFEKLPDLIGAANDLAGEDLAVELVKF